MNLLKGKIKNNKNIAVNFSYLSVLQIFKIILPFLTYPYLLRVLGKELYGSIIFAQAIIIYVTLFVDFGFNISGAKATAVNRDDKTKLSEIVSAIYTSKFTMWIICLVIYMLIICFLPFARKDFWLYFITFFISMNELLLPIWFFQGIEKMQYTTFVNIITQLFFTVAIFFTVHQKSDYLLVPILNSMGAVLGGSFASYIVFKKEKVKFVLLPFKTIYLYFKESLPLFASIASVQFYLRINKILVGSFLGMSEVAIYDLGEKISGLLKVPIQILNQATFPKTSREKNVSFINKVMLLSFVSVSVAYLCVFVFSKWIVLVFMGEPNQMAVNIIRILCLSAVFGSLNTFLAGGRLIPFGYSSVYMKLVIRNVLFFFSVIGILWITNTITVYSLALMIVLVEIFYLLSLLYRTDKLHILNGK
jgi:PST family polysaccharide transporter